MFSVDYYSMKGKVREILLLLSSNSLITSQTLKKDCIFLSFMFKVGICCKVCYLFFNFYTT